MKLSSFWEVLLVFISPPAPQGRAGLTGNIYAPSERQEHVGQRDRNHHPSGYLRLTDLEGSKLGTRLPLPGRDLHRIAVRLSLFENPEGGLGQVTGDGADGHSVALAPANTIV